MLPANKEWNLKMAQKKETGSHKERPARADHLGHRWRLRERFQMARFKGFHDYEVLEILLTFALPRIDTKSLAKELLRSFGSLSGVFDASEDELRRIRGVGPRAAQLVALIKEVAASYLRDRMVRSDVLRTPDAVASYCRLLLGGRKNESVHVLFVNGRNAVLGDATLFEGTTGETTAYPRRIAEEALSRGASGIILVHNHPSGYVQPSAEDNALTDRVLEALRTVDVRLLDHLIVGREGYHSFRAAGYFRAMQGSPRANELGAGGDR